MDRFALAAGNRLVGNPAGAAGIELVGGGLALFAWQDCLVAMTGAAGSLVVDERAHPGWMAVYVRRGSVMRLGAAEIGMWSYLAVRGGVQVPLVMGSRATYQRGGFGGLQGRTLAAGDLLPISPMSGGETLRAGRSLPEAFRPAYSNEPTLRVVLGPQAGAFSASGIATFLESEYSLTDTADRMGYRLEGPPIEHAGAADILSDGIPLGAIQVPASGQPIVMMSDRQPTGGYTKIAVVIRADLPILAQCRPGSSRLRFQSVTVESGQAAYRWQQHGLEDGLQATDDELILFARS
jgi:biotin-dependent carboxylase-like uncharacterized protein